MAEGMHGKGYAWQEGMNGKGLGVFTGETPTEVGGTHPTGMHTCTFQFSNNQCTTLH